jgi:hypothetical protein
VAVQVAVMQIIVAEQVVEVIAHLELLVVMELQTQAVVVGPVLVLVQLAVQVVQA